ncbi:MAG: ATP-binding protein, partial [Pseudomonadota bacterium]
TVAFLAGSAALGGLGLYGVAERWMFARAAASGMDAGRAFSATWETAPEAAALLDATGRVLALNAAARREGADGGAGPERLIPRATIARDTVFRLLNGAADGRAQRLRTALSDGARIEVTVWALGAGRYLWRWRAEEAVETGPDADRGAMAMADAGAHWCRIAVDGAILETSASFERAFGLSGDGARGFDRLFPEAAAERALAPDEERVFIGARIGAGARRGALANLLYLPIGARGEAVCVAARPREALRAAEATEGGALAAHVDALGAAVAELDGGDDVFGALAAALLVRDAPVGVAALALDGVVLQANGVAARLLSGDEGGAVARAPLIDWVSPHEREDVAAQVAATRAAGGGVGPAIEVALRDASGRSREAQLYFSRVASPRGPLIICFMIDASERRGLEARYHQSQKLHAVGELAGGVAHDFNNLLTVILGACETLLERATVTDPHYGDLSAIQGSARRAATLVSQLLAYSRKQKLTPKVTDLSELIGDLSFMLDRMLGASSGAGGRARGVPVKLELDLDESVWPTRVDVNQFEQVVTNLVVNARDAMKEQGGGRIRLSCANAQQETPRTGANFAMPAGDYVRVAVSDDGCGIPKDKLQKIFDPFFTTKP